MKTCTRCKEEKDFSQFNTYPKNGKRYMKSMCKVCESEYYKPYLKEYCRRLEVKERHRKRAVSDKGRELNRLRSRKYRSTDEGRKKDNVRGRLHQAIKSGKIKVPETCSKCGEYRPVEAHHEDYDKPFDVTWLCKQCHEDTHHLNEGHKPLE